MLFPPGRLEKYGEYKVTLRQCSLLAPHVFQRSRIPPNYRVFIRLRLWEYAEK